MCLSYTSSRLVMWLTYQDPRVVVQALVQVVIVIVTVTVTRVVR